MTMHDELLSNQYWMIGSDHIETYRLMLVKLLESPESDSRYDALRRQRATKITDFSGSGSSMSVSTKKVAVLQLKGALTKQDGYCNTGMLSKAEEIRKYAKDSEIDGIVIEIDSGGGMVDGTATLCESIDQAKKSKPVLAYIKEGSCASAAYKIAMHCDKVIAQYSSCQVGRSSNLY